MPFERLDELSHSLAPHYEALRAIRTRSELHRSPLHAEIGAEIARVVGGVEVGVHSAPRPPRDPGRLRVVAWNVQRGARFEELLGALRGDPVLRDADVLLLVEVDCGMGRSGNRHVARELADALAMHYAFAPSYLVLEDDYLENPDGVANTRALAGAAILSRLPLLGVENVDLPELRDKFSSSEKRLGKKRALCAEVRLGGVPLVLGAVHLDSTASPAQRARQLDFLLERMEARLAPAALVGGDFNSSTYDSSSTGALLRDLSHKLFRVGFKRTVLRYMEPERHQERPVFDALAARGYSVEGWNDPGHGTYRYDLHSDYAVEKVRRQVGTPLVRLLQYKLRPWGGVVPARLDWMAGRGLAPHDPRVVAPVGADGVPVSDHAAVVVDVATA